MSNKAAISAGRRNDDSRLGYLVPEKPMSFDRSRKGKVMGDSSFRQNMEEDFMSRKVEDFIPRKAEYEMKSIVMTAKNLECFGTNTVLPPKYPIHQI